MASTWKLKNLKKVYRKSLQEKFMEVNESSKKFMKMAWCSEISRLFEVWSD